MPYARWMASTLDWYGCATFALRTAGLTVFLDAYIDRSANAAGPRVTADEIDECDWIVVGHSHFDHLYGAERIAANTGARIIGSYETVRVMEQAGVPLDQMICVAGGETVALSDSVRVSVFPSQHSLRVVAHEDGAGRRGVHRRPGSHVAGAAGPVRRPRGPLRRRDAGRVVRAPPGREPGRPRRRWRARVPVRHARRLVALPGHLGHWSGILRGLRPDVAIVAAAGRGNVDGEPTQGSLAQFVGRRGRPARPRRVVLCHHDDWLPGFSVDTDVEPIRAELARVAPSTTLVDLGYLDATAILP